MVSLFKTNSLLTALAGVLYVILININLFEVNALQNNISSGPLSDIFYSLLKYVGADSGVWLFLIYILILLFQAFKFNDIFMKNKIFPNKNFLGFMSYATVMAVLNFYSFLSPAFLALTFIIPGLEQLFETSKQDATVSHFFNTAFWMSMAALFYSPLVILPIFIFVGFAIISGFYWRNWLASLVGFLVPYFLLFTYYFNQGETVFFLQSTNPFRSEYVQWPELDSKIWIQLGIIAFILIFSLILTRAKFFLGIVRIRKIYQVLSLFVPVIMLVFIFITDISIDILVLILIPLSAYLAHSLGYVKKALRAELVQLIIIVSIVLTHFFKI